MSAISTQLTARLIRQYSHQPFQKDSSHYRLKACAMTGYLCSAFTLPFVPAYIASKRAERDGSYATR
ncbi:hypothetical protein EJ08DRAFT_577821 [Tothia fuscella]|uniref:Uncharacterized protein n=1 Tax=Tothia fuscella TaxID=1048955 RepID=A0A9P4P3Y8_9PEZI|nr:hypothetical protein EJ08DRAFT_577821 [Tothia fuscella]